MTADEHMEPLPVPHQTTLSSLGVILASELHGGHQSRVFSAQRNGEDVVVKLVDGRHVDRSFQVRLEVMAALADIDDSVVAPIPIAGLLATPIGDWIAVVTPFVAGEPPDVDSQRDVRRMASTLANLHRSLGRLPAFDLPTVAALSGVDHRGFGPPQLLHGDYSSANVIFTGHRTRVIDFDDCGYGPVEFEVGNTLYMALFDAAMSSAMDGYEQFRRWFVDEYGSVSGQMLRDDLLDLAVSLRVDALARWLEAPETAPIGIRTATPAWRDALRAFVRSQGGDQHTQL